MLLEVVIFARPKFGSQYPFNNDGQTLLFRLHWIYFRHISDRAVRPRNRLFFVQTL